MMKKVAVLLCLVASETDAFAFNQQGKHSNSNLNRIKSFTSASTIPRSASLQLLRSSNTDEEAKSTTLTSDLSSPSSSSIALKNETTTATTTSLAARTQLVEAPPLPTETTDSPLPDWLEPLAWRAVIVVLCALWASNFAVAKLVMAEPGVDSSLYALSRFGVAAASLAPFALRSVVKGQQEAAANNSEINPAMDAETLKESVICGSWVAFGYLGQTLGLLSTTASKSCVICSMHCVFVALVAEVWRVQKASAEALSSSITPIGGDGDDDATGFDLMRLLPAAVAVIGVAIVELKGAGGSPTVGDALSFAQPIGFGMGYLILENIMVKKPEAALPVSAIKLAVVTVASFLMFQASPLLHGGTIGDIALQVPDFSPILHSPAAMGGILYTGLVTTALALWVESIAFAKVPATDASLILTTEPLFAAGCGAIVLGETFGTSDYVGASLIVGACALSIFMESPAVEASSEH